MNDQPNVAVEVVVDFVQNASVFRDGLQARPATGAGVETRDTVLPVCGDSF
jgi:hypothetical protein